MRAWRVLPDNGYHQDVGTLRREIDDLRKAGAFLDNTRVRGMVGFVSSPVSDDLADRAVGGGFVVGTQTDLTLTKTQKELIDAKTQTLFREGLRLQTRLLELTKQWQGAVAEIAQAQWDLKVAEFMRQNSGTLALRRQAEVHSAEANDRLHQAVLRYNALSGRSPSDPIPFDNLNAADVQTLMAEIRKTVAAPDRLSDILHSLDPDQMQAQLGEEAFNLVDWIPFVDKLTVGVGAQLQDLMANQVLGVGVTRRLPVYDPHSDAADKAYHFEGQAAIEEMEQVQAERRLTAQKEQEQARLWRISADAAPRLMRQPGVGERHPPTAITSSAPRCSRPSTPGAGMRAGARRRHEVGVGRAWASADQTFVSASRTTKPTPPAGGPSARLGGVARPGRAACASPRRPGWPKITTTASKGLGGSLGSA